MSEQAPRHHTEALPAPGSHELLTAQASPEQLTHARKEARKAKHEARKAIAEVRSKTETNPFEQILVAEKNAQPRPAMHINRELRRITLQRELQLIRRKLSFTDRSLSKVIHQPVVRAVSEGASKTVSRPSGLLGGGLVSLIGTTGYLLLANYVGFTYNYGVFVVLFAAGFVLGLVLELAVHFATGGHQKSES